VLLGQLTKKRRPRLYRGRPLVEFNGAGQRRHPQPPPTAEVVKTRVGGTSGAGLRHLKRKVEQVEAVDTQSRSLALLHAVQDTSPLHTESASDEAVLRHGGGRGEAHNFVCRRQSVANRRGT